MGGGPVGDWYVARIKLSFSGLVLFAMRIRLHTIGIFNSSPISELGKKKKDEQLVDTPTKDANDLKILGNIRGEKNSDETWGETLDCKQWQHRMSLE